MPNHDLAAFTRRDDFSGTEDYTDHIPTPEEEQRITEHLRADTNGPESWDLHGGFDTSDYTTAGDQ